MKTILVDAYHTFVIPVQWMFQEMHKLLETYPNQKIILTNANKEEMEKLGIVNLPYEVFSLAHAPDKTGEWYYDAFLKKYNLPTKEVIYFENNIDAVEKARAVGIVTYHYNREKRDLVTLKNFLDENL